MPKTAYELGISDWSSDVCSSDLTARCLVSSHGRGRRGTGVHPGRSDALPREGAPVPGRLRADAQRVGLRDRRSLHGAGDRAQTGRKRGRRSEESRVGKEGVSTGSKRCVQERITKKNRKKA